jgi:hypothetical protein
MLTQFTAIVLLAAPVISGLPPVSTATLVGVSVYALLRLVRGARSGLSYVAHACFGNGDCLSVWFLAPDALLRTQPADSSRGALKHPGFGFSARTSGLELHRRPPPPNNSFKPTPCRGVGRVLCATLARVRRPATGRLNSGVRGLGCDCCNSPHREDGPRSHHRLFGRAI